MRQRLVNTLLADVAFRGRVLLPDIHRADALDDLLDVCQKIVDGDPRAPTWWGYQAELRQIVEQLGRLRGGQGKDD